MNAMFVKEMQQFVRSLSLKITGLVTCLAFGVIYLLWQIKVPQTFEPYRMATPMLYFFCIPGLCFFGLLFILGASAGRWRQELGDPAFSPGVTTCTPVWQLACGKLAALLSQMMLAVVISGVIPVAIACRMPVIKFIRENVNAMFDPDELLFAVFQEPVKIFILVICAVISWGTLTLALCSLKPRTRGRFDIGAVAAMLILVPQAIAWFAVIGKEEMFVMILVRTLVQLVGGFFLICAGVSAPASNRLLGFKIWTFFSVLCISPLLYWSSGEFSVKLFASEMETLGWFFLLVSLFERLAQTRRVLSSFRNPVWFVLGFPFSTGALNSVVLSGLCFGIAKALDPEVVLMPYLIVAATVSLANAIGVLGDMRNVRVFRWLVVLLVIIGAGIFVSECERRGLQFDWQKNRDGICVIMTIMAVVLNIPLIKRYNYRKKSL